MKKFELTYVSLHIIGMVLMTLDHLWATLFPYLEILTCVGRIAFPIFAFLTVEGYTHTSDVKKYMKRLFIFALISEIPFNYLMVSNWVYPFHQNVIWTFLEGVIMFRLMDKVKKNTWYYPIVISLIVLLFFIIGSITFVDYYGTGLLTMAIFYIFKERKPLNIIITIILIYYINTNILGGYYYNINILGFNFELVQQSLATLALIPIYLYKGKKGNSPNWFKYFNYAFYPGHIIIIYTIYRLFS